jgi:hypothetical protein
MLFLNFLHVDQFAGHLKDKNVRDVYVTHSFERLESVDKRIVKITLTARVADYIAVCETTSPQEPNLSIDDQAIHLFKQLDHLKERLASFDIQVFDGYWSGVAPERLNR